MGLFVLDLKFGIPKQLTKLVLMLSQQRDFWTLTRVIKEWFLRHHLNPHVILISESVSLVPLTGDKPLLAAPSTIGLAPVLSSEQLIPESEFNLSFDAPLVEALVSNSDDFPAPASALLASNEEVIPSAALVSDAQPDTDHDISWPGSASMNPNALFAKRGRIASTHSPDSSVVILNDYFGR